MYKDHPRTMKTSGLNVHKKTVNEASILITESDFQDNGDWLQTFTLNLMCTLSGTSNTVCCFNVVLFVVCL